jgi:valyl-tRNA synthetase
MNVPPSVKTKLYLEINDKKTVEECKIFIQKMAFCNEIELVENADFDNCVACISNSARAFIPTDQLIDKSKELERLDKELKNAEKDIDFLSKKLNNEGFLAKAPEKLVEIERNKLKIAEEKKEKILKSIEDLK